MNDGTIALRIEEWIGVGAITVGVVIGIGFLLLWILANGMSDAE